MSQRIIITGASGFLGQHCCRVFAASGWQVIALSRSGGPDIDGVESVVCDLLDPAQTGAAISRLKASHLLHLAWHDAPRDRWTSPVNLDWVAASLALARAFAAAGGERLILAGSCAQYDWSQGPVLSEAETPLNPASLYGAAKLALSDLLQTASGSLGISVCEARIFFCYGPGEPAGRLVPDLIAGLRAGTSVPCTDGLQIRDYLHAEDIARALAMIAASDLSGPVNVGSGEGLAVRTLIAEVADQLGRPDLPQYGALTRAADDPPELCADVTRLQALGFAPHFDLQSGVADTLARWATR